MSVEQSDFVRLLGDKPKIRVLTHFVEGRDFDYNITSIAESSDVSRGTVRDILNELTSHQIIIKTRKLGKSQMFQLNKESAKAKALIDLYDAIININLMRLSEREED